MLRKIVAIVMSSMVGLILTFIVALIATLFVYAGWNWGVVPAIEGAKVLDLAQAFWFSLGLNIIGSAFKSKVSINES